MSSRAAVAVEMLITTSSSASAKRVIHDVTTADLMTSSRLSATLLLSRQNIFMNLSGISVLR